MNRTELHALMRQQTAQVAALGQVGEIAMGAQNRTADDVAAIMTSADKATAMADEMKSAAPGLVGKDQRLAGQFEHGLRTWATACRWLADGLTGEAKLLAMGKAAYQKGADEIAAALRSLQ